MSHMPGSTVDSTPGQHDDKVVISSASSLEYYFGTFTSCVGVPQQWEIGMAGCQKSNGALITDAFWILAGKPAEFDFAKASALASQLSVEAVCFFSHKLHYEFETLFWAVAEHPSYAPWKIAFECLRRIDVDCMRRNKSSDAEVKKEFESFAAALGGLRLPPMHQDIKEEWDILFCEQAIEHAIKAKDWEKWATSMLRLLDLKEARGSSYHFTSSE